MKLRKLNYSEHFVNNEKRNPWTLKNLILGDFNLIVGKNSTGKSRTLNTIANLANKVILANQIGISTGEWDITFETQDKKEFNYSLTLSNKKIIKEKITIDSKVILDRDSDKAEITQGRKKEIVNPPQDKLVLQVRRDTVAYPFFEDLIDWASNAHYFNFSTMEPNMIEVLVRSEGGLMKFPNLNVFPSLLDKMSEENIRTIVNDYKEIGFEIENASTEKVEQLDLPIEAKIVKITENGLSYPLKQFEMSSGLIKAFAQLVIIQHLLIENKGKDITLIIDDLCEGLDFERATSYAKILLKKLKGTNIQVIATTNDRFLMNTIDVKHWNILLRNNTQVTAYNAVNNEELFKNFEDTGLSNFSLLSSDFITKNE